MILLFFLAIPLLAAPIVWFSGERFSRIASIVLSLGQALFTMFLWNQVLSFPERFNIDLPWIESPVIHFALTMDGLSYLMLVLTNVLFPFIILTVTPKYTEGRPLLYALMFFMLFALNGVFMAADGFLYYVFWEMALIPIYFIVMLWGGENRMRITFTFFLYTLAGSLFMLLALIYLYQKSGSFALSSLYAVQLTQWEQIGCFLCFFIAFAIKIPIFPFHTWQADTYSNAPVFGSVLLSAIMLKMGTYSILRWLLPLFPLANKVLIPYVIVLCVIGVIYASVIAIYQQHLKRLVAYSSMAHVGLLAAGIFSLTPTGMIGSVLQMLAHGVNVLALFYIVELIYRRTGSFTISDLGGIRQSAPILTTVFLIVVLANVAFPLTNAFVGEFMLLYGIFSYNTILGIFAGLSVILGAVYMLRMFQYVMLGPDKVRIQPVDDLSISELLYFLPLLFIIFFTGIYTTPLTDMTRSAIDVIYAYATR